MVGAHDVRVLSVAALEVAGRSARGGHDGAQKQGQHDGGTHRRNGNHQLDGCPVARGLAGDARSSSASWVVAQQILGGAVKRKTMRGGAGRCSAHRQGEQTAGVTRGRPGRRSGFLRQSKGWLRGWPRRPSELVPRGCRPPSPVPLVSAGFRSLERKYWRFLGFVVSCRRGGLWPMRPQRVLRPLRARSRAPDCSAPSGSYLDGAFSFQAFFPSTKGTRKRIPPPDFRQSGEFYLVAPASRRVLLSDFLAPNGSCRGSSLRWRRRAAPAPGRRSETTRA